MSEQILPIPQEVAEKNQNGKPNIPLTRRAALKIGGATALSALLAACGIKLNENQAVPSQTPKPTIAEPSKTLEVKNQNQISVGGYLEQDPFYPSIENIKFIFPEGIIDGEKPHVLAGDQFSLFFQLDNSLPIPNLRIDLANLLGLPSNGGRILINTNTASGLTDFKNYRDNLSDMISSQHPDIKLDDGSLDILDDMQIRYGMQDNKLSVNLTLVNKEFSYTDDSGSHTHNPAERFLTGKAGIGIARRGEIDPETVLGPAPLTIENLILTNQENRTLNAQHQFEINNPQRTEISVERTQPNSDQVGSSETTPQKETNPWIDRKWQPNETVSVSSWWDDMVTKGYIAVDSIAYQYAGQKINIFRAYTNLVPNPNNYYELGYAFSGNCITLLKEMEAESRGHIKVLPEAYQQIPGGDNCQVFSNKK